MQIRFKKALLLNVIIASFASPFATADTLQQIFDLALTNDTDIRAAEATLKAGLENRSLGRSGLLPSISLNASYTDSERTSSNSDPLAPPSEPQISESTRLSATLNQTLFDLPEWYAYKRGDALAEEAEQNYLSAKQDLIVRVTTGYFNVLRALDTMNATKAEEVAFASQLEQTQQRYEVGLIAVTDVYEAQASYDSVVARLVDAIGSVGIAFENLTVLTGRDHSSIAPLSRDFPITAPIPESADEWVELALENSYELKSATFSRDASSYNATRAKSEHLPSLDLRIEYVDTSITNNEAANQQQVTNANNENQQSSIGLSLNVPLYLGGSTSASRRQANYQYLAAEENLSGIQRSLIQNTRNQHLTVRIDVSEVNAREKAILSSQTAYEATKAGYEVGTRNLVDVLNAEQTLYQTRRDYFTARYDYIIDLFTLDQLVGGLSSANVAEIEKWLEPSLSTPKSIVEQSLPGLALPNRQNNPSSQNNGPTVIKANRGSAVDDAEQTPEQVLELWAQAWSNLDAESYSSYYVSEYLANQNRIQRFSELSDVSLSLSNINIIEQTSRSTIVEFTQTYRSSNYSDRTQKQLSLVKMDNGDWKIDSERSLSVEVL